MTFSTYNKIMEVALHQSWMSWRAAINCNNKTKNNREVSYFQLSKDTSIHKDWIHAIGHPLDSLPSKIEKLQKFLNSYSQEQTGKIYCHSFESFHKIYSNFIYSELLNSGRGIFRALSNI